MRTSVVVMLALAAVFGVLAVFAGQRWLSHQAELQRQNVAQGESRPVPLAPAPLATLVVAANALKYGEELTAGQLKEIPWPAGDLPKGAFRTREELLKEKRLVLFPLQSDEPILEGKITGSGQRATLSALISEGMGAVTIQVNEVVGVAGFVLPGERVDVLMTRFETGGDGGPQGANAASATQNSYADIILREARVLAAGQVADATTNKPAIVNAVTLEVAPLDAQKLALAARAGTLSLILRKAGERAGSLPARRVTLGEIGHATGPESSTVISVARGVELRQYAVRSGSAPATIAQSNLP
jgi:pilus assembly protein CpaB